MRARIFGTLLSLVFIAITISQVNLSEFADALGRGQYTWVIPAALVTAIGYVLRVSRWRWIAGPGAFASYVDASSALLIGFAANNVLPLRLGELVRSYAAARHSAHRKTFFLATIVVERVLDGIILVAILGVASFLTPLPEGGREIQLAVSGIFVLGALAVWLIARADPRALSILDRVLQVAPARVSKSIEKRLPAFIEGFAQLRTGANLTRILGVSLLIWCCELTSYALIVHAFGVDFSGVTMLAGPAVLMTAVNFSTMIPAAPGYIGVYHLSGVAALAVFGVSREVALAIATVSHAMQYILVTAAGLTMLGREHLSLRGVSEAATADDDTEADELQGVPVS